MTSENIISSRPLRIRTITYRITTAIVIIGMLSGGASQVSRADYQIETFTNLGYPLYLMTIIGVWKILGGIVLLLPRFFLLKIWAYAGLFFVTTSAAISHAMNGDIKSMIIPLIVAAITLTSCLLNPRISAAAKVAQLKE